VTTKVFVGNLDFQTTDQALADAFVDCGKVKSGVIITRGRRSLGYGFVEFEGADAAEKAVETKNGTELSKRQIKVELVRDPADRPIREPRKEGTSDQKGDVEKGERGERRERRERGGERGGDRGGDRGERGEQVGGSGNRRQGGRRGGGGGGFGGQNKRRFARRDDAEPTQGGKSNNTGGGNNNQTTPNRDRDRDNNQSPSNPDNKNQSQKPKRRQRRRRNNERTSTNDNTQAQSPPKEKILSKTAIFVANIPFEAKDEDLKNFFKDSNPKSAHVVTTQTGRSRGYGFVDFDNEKDQQHSIQTKNKAKWTTPEKGDREISVSASHSQPKEENVQSST